VSIDINDDIVQDFLVEVGEIIEQLGEQLIGLETQPDDKDALNSVFRGFHTIKGGAGFLALDALVDVCHQAENIFDLLRKGERTVNADLMDNILQALDCIQDMFSQIQLGNMPAPADAALIEKLEKYSHPETAEEQVGNSSQPETAALVAEQVEAVQEAEVEPGPTASEDNNAQTTKASDDITEEEFDRMLDELHGEGKPINVGQTLVDLDATQKNPANNIVNNEITEDEFEALLDELQSQSKGAFAETSIVEASEKNDIPVEQGNENTEAIKIKSFDEFIIDADDHINLDLEHTHQQTPFCLSSLAPAHPSAPMPVITMARVLPRYLFATELKVISMQGL